MTEEGGTQIRIFLGKKFNKLFENSYEGTSLSNCSYIFGNYTYINNLIYSNISESYIDCISQNLNIIDNEYKTFYTSNDLHKIYLNFVEINLNVSIESLRMDFDLKYIYNTNATIYDYYPNNVDYTFVNHSIFLTLETNSNFYYLTNNINIQNLIIIQMK